MKKKSMTDRDKKVLALAIMTGAVMFLCGDYGTYVANKPESVTYREYINNLEAGMDITVPTGKGNYTEIVEDKIDTVYYDPDSDYWRYTLWTDESRAEYEKWLADGKSAADFEYDYAKENWRVFEMPDGTADTLQEHIIKYDGIACRQIVKKSFMPLIVTTLPVVGGTFATILLMVGFLAFYTKKMSGLGGIDRDLLVRDTGVRFKDVIGHDEVIRDLQLIVKLMQRSRSGKTEHFNANIPRGMLFSGIPGTGKTLLAKAVAGEAGVPFLYMNASGFVEMYVGVGAKRVRQLFQMARKNAPCIIFIDEIDAVGTDRSATTTSEQKQTINALLQEMDGFDTKSGIFIIAATNNAESLDKALVRSGRFDRQVIINPPKDYTVRAKLFEQYLKDDDCKADIELVAKQCVGFTGADINAVCNEARLIAITQDSDSITTEILEEAIDRKIFKGNHVREKRSEDISVIAYHEAGHALMNVLLNIPVARATIIGTTGGVGGAVFREDETKSMQTKQDLLNYVMVAYAGRAAEEVMFGADNITTGAGNDFEKATEILKACVRNYAFDEKKIVISDEQSVFSEYVFNRTSALADELYQRTVTLISENRSKLKDIANLLLEKETVSCEEIRMLIEPKQE